MSMSFRGVRCPRGSGYRQARALRRCADTDLEAADVAALLNLTPWLLGEVLSFSRSGDLAAASSDVENASGGGRNRCGLAPALKRRTMALGRRLAATWKGIAI